MTMGNFTDREDLEGTVEAFLPVFGLAIRRAGFVSRASDGQPNRNW